MEARLTLLFERLEKVEQDARQLCQRAETEPTNLQDFIRTKFLLKNSVETVNSEIHKYINECSIELITRGTRAQLAAEDILSNIEASITTSSFLEKEDRKKAHTESNHCKLPKLQLPTFSGDILKWHEFWDRFETTIHKRNISNADKLSYLISSLEGLALETVEGLAITNSNYNIAYETLQKRYGNKDALIDAHYEALLKIPKATDSSVDCRNTLNLIERHLRILNSLGEQTDGNHFRVTLLGKFPEKVIYENNLMTKDNSVGSLRLNLEHIISSMEKSMKTQSNSQDLLINQPVTTEALSTISSVKNNIKFNKNRYSEMSRKRKNFYTSTHHSQKRMKFTCIFCNGTHYNSDCSEVRTIAERKKILGKKCYRCFKEGHNIKNCRIKRNCFYCKGIHNQALCPQKIGKHIKVNKFKTYGLSRIDNKCTILQTATARVKAQNKEIICRILLDSGSQRSYITTQAAENLSLIADNEEILMIFTFGSNKAKETLSPSAEILINTKRGIQRKLRVNIISHIIGKIKPPTVKLDSLMDIAADDGSVGGRIDLLIGNDYYFTFMRTEKIEINENLYIIDSDFGWVITGVSNNSKGDKNDVLSVLTFCRCDESHVPYYVEPDLPLRDIDMRFLWSLESIGINDSTKVTREEEAIQHFNETVKYEGQRYEVKWPWIQYPPELCTNFGLAIGRLSNLIKRLDKVALIEYDSILQEQMKAGIIEVVPPSEEVIGSRPVHYLPHHSVRQEGKNSRIVYDASAKTKMQKSLNECLYRGPSMVEDLTALLLSFRTNKVAITADVEKAFLQIGLQKDDRDVTRFLWLKDISKGFAADNILYLRFCRVPFGIISSPFLLTATIRHHLSKKNHNLLKAMADKCYVDNLVTGTSSTGAAKILYREIKGAFEEISMNLRDWISNDNEFINSIPKQFQAEHSKTVKVLGLLWHVEEDTMEIKLRENMFSNEYIDTIKNKREVLRTIASFFDPCGFISPLILPAKLLLQELWLNKIDWNTQLSTEIMEKLSNIMKNLKLVKNIRIPRYLGCNIKFDENTKFELHCFTDASEKAYAAVTYIRIIRYNVIKTIFIMSKSRVTPIRQKENLKIPRLELLGYTIGSRLLVYVKNALGLPILKQYLWTDSTIVLCWMKSNKLLHPFVSRRVIEIKQNKNTEWRYVNTNENPADIATRPERWDSQEQLWFHGPHFLLKDVNCWPSIAEAATFCVAGESLVTVFPDRQDRQDTHEFEEDQEVCANIPNIPCAEDDNVTSEVIVIRKLQAQHFPEEVQGKQTNLCRNLGLFLDVDGLLRCQGRMAHTIWEYDAKHPVLIPTDCDFTKQLIQDIHEKNYHVGVSHTLSILRQHYWVPKGRAQVQKVIQKCQRCVKHGGGPYSLPPTPDLPPERVNYSAPFKYTGIDYCGPLYVRSNSGKEKRWVCLMTCLAIRAVHIEVVADLTAEVCLQALRRFIATRGVPDLIVSDNALQFKLSAEILENAYCIKNKIKWRFIPQLAPWHGGFYERLIGLVKHCLKRTLNKHFLTDSQLSTIIKEVEAVINTRPLTYVGSDQDYILKPMDFLSMGKCIVTEPSTADCRNATITKHAIIEGWRRGNMVVGEYKKMFINQYLQGLRERSRNCVRQPRIKSKQPPVLGDVVQIKGESKNRDMWKVGKIVSLIKGSDGECRVAKVRVGDSELVRSIGHLYPLEVEEVPIPEENIEVRSNNQVVRDSVPGTDENILENELDDLHLRVSVPEEREIQDKRTPLIPQLTSLDSPVSNEQISSDLCNNNSHVETVERNLETRGKRDAAIKAREKIAEWTRQLAVVLWAAGSVAKERDPQH